MILICPVSGKSSIWERTLVHWLESELFHAFLYDLYTAVTAIWMCKNGDIAFMHKTPLLLRPPRFGPSADRRWSKSLGRSRTVVQHFGHCPKTSKADRDWEWIETGRFPPFVGTLCSTTVARASDRITASYSHQPSWKEAKRMYYDRKLQSLWHAIGWAVKESERSVNSSTNCRSNSQIIGSYLCRIFVKTCSPNFTNI